MIKGSLLAGLGQRKRFASHKAGELHRMGELLLSAFICSPENQNVSRLTFYYCKISVLHSYVRIDVIDAIVSLQCAFLHSGTDVGVPQYNCNKLLSLFLIPLQKNKNISHRSPADVNIESAAQA